MENYVMNRFVTVWVSILFFSVISVSEAWALSGWRDRRGLYFGVSSAAGLSYADVDGAEGQFGVNLGLRLGAGITKRLTLDGAFTTRLESDDVILKGLRTESQTDYTAQTYTFGLGINYFVQRGLYLRLLVGLSQREEQFDSAADGTVSGEFTGLGIGSGFGYEFFSGRRLAAGFIFEALSQIYEEGTINTATFGFTATWY